MSLVQAVGSLILINRRQSIQLFPQKLRNVWSEWQLRALILLSLTSQIVLVILGNRRKYIAKTWITVIVWLFYSLADSVATMAIGILSNNIDEVYSDGNKNSSSLEYELTAFWAPFLLLHLGGTDTITAFSLEDNELWLRHSFGVIAQAVTTAYVLLMSWSISSRLSPLFIVVFFVGLIKYCERVWALFSASEKRFRDSIPQHMTNETRIMEECELKKLEGYHVTEHQVLVVEVPAFDNSVSEFDDTIEILLAHSFFDMVKRLFADLILGFQDRDASRAIFESNQMQMHPEKALKVIEIELGLMYDFLYTKATVVYSLWGIIRRIIASFLIIGVLVLVSLDRALFGTTHSSKIELTMTLVLLVVALLVDLCAFGELCFSDQTAHWLIKHNKIELLRIINRIHPMIPWNWGKKRKRWSKTVEQISLLSFSLATRKKPWFCHKILKKLGIEEAADIFWYKSITPPDPLYLDRNENLPKIIFQEVTDVRSWAEKNRKNTDLKTLYGSRGGLTLEKYNRKDLEWSVNMEFEQSILVWHLATEIYYYYQLDDRRPPYTSSSWTHCHDRVKCLSRYMLYLLIEHPNMLPIGIGQIKFRDLYSDLGNFIETYISKPFKDVDEKKASKKLIKIVNDEEMLVGRGDMSKFLIFRGCKLAMQLKTENEEGHSWLVIGHVWKEMLGHAASQCKGRLHAQQLRRGGEYLTHVWLLMAHFGFNDHFQINQSHAIAETVLS